MSKDILYKEYNKIYPIMTKLKNEPFLSFRESLQLEALENKAKQLIDRIESAYAEDDNGNS